MQVSKWRPGPLILFIVFFTFSGVQAQEPTECQDGFHQVTHALGHACVTENPQRVVALEWTYVEDLLALGVQPVGIADIEGYHAWVNIPVSLDESVADVGTRNEPNLERIAELNPDLIIGVNFRLTGNYDDLTAIAPTLVFNPYPEDLAVSQYEEMITTFTTIAQVVNREAEGQAVLENLEATYERAQAALETAGQDGESFILSQGWTNDSVATFRLFTENALAVQILEQIGLENAWDDAPQLYGYTEIGIEGFAELRDADFNFVYVAQENDNSFFEESPLWNSLEFVQSEKAYWLGGDAWLFGGPLSAEVIVETILQALGIDLPAAQDEASFPVTVEHKFGSTTITAAPQRVVSLGYTEHDTLLALGITPVAVRYWYGDASDAIFPWAEDEAGGTVPEVLNMPFGGLNYEAILALKPDLISAVDAGITQEEYALLSQIAPTIAQSGDYIDFGMPWQEATRLIGAAVGKTQEADAVVERVESLFAEVREENPAFAGKRVAVAYNYGEARTYGFYTAQDARGRFFTELGFVIPDELVEIAGESYYADISAERIDLLDQDLLIFMGLQFADGGREAIEADPLISQLEAVQDGRVIFIPEAYDDALQFSTVLSLEYAIEGLLPVLQAAQTTETAQSSSECEAGYWLFDHERLVTDPVCIPESPQRVISLDMPATEFLLLNDIPIVGVFGYAADEISAITPGLADELAGIPTFGWPPNLELITELNPDLIIAYKDSSLFYEGMEAIAPLVVYDAAYATDWKSSTAFWSEVFQKEDAYADMLATYEARVTELQEALGEDRGEIEVSAFVPSPDYPMIWLVDSAQGVILQDVGLGRPESQAVTFAEGGYAEGGADYGFVAVSGERLDLADGDEIFIFTWPSTDPDVQAENLQYLRDFNDNNALWQTLSGVREGSVHIVGPHWFRAQTYLAAHLILDDLFANLTDAEPVIPSPAQALIEAEVTTSGD